MTPAFLHPLNFAASLIPINKLPMIGLKKSLFDMCCENAVLLVGPILLGVLRFQRAETHPLRSHTLHWKVAC
jgi:hypothetical protein